MAGAPLLQTQAETDVVVQRGEEKAQGRCYCKVLPVFKISPFLYREKRESNFLHRQRVIG